MGFLTSSRKRDPIPYSSSPDFHVSKKLKFSSINQTSYQTLGSLNSTVSRISRYPETTPRFRREVHAPCRILKFGSSKSKNIVHGEKETSSGDDMWNFLNKKLDFLKRTAIAACRYLGKELIQVDDEPEKAGKEIVSDDLSVEEVEAIEEDGKEVMSMVLDRRSSFGVAGDKHDNDVKVVEERSVVTMDGDFGVANVGNNLDSLALKREDVSSVEVYKKLLENAERRSGKLTALQSEIEWNERKLSSLLLSRPVKKTEEKLVQEIPREPFVPLMEEEETKVKSAFSTNNRRRVLVTHKNSNIDITGQVLQCLAPGAWLNDEVINVYLELLKEREQREPHKFLKCHFFNTFFYKKLTSGEKNIHDYRAVKRWTTEKKLGYFLVECDKVFVPVHREVHWCLAIINKKDQKFQYLDSLKGRDFKVLENLAKYYVEEVKDKNKKDIDVSNWDREFLEDLPEQQNGHDCGMFMIKYADFYSRGLGLCFTQEHMPYFRLRTAKEILRLRAD